MSDNPTLPEKIEKVQFVNTVEEPPKPEPKKEVEKDPYLLIVDSRYLNDFGINPFELAIEDYFYGSITVTMWDDQASIGHVKGGHAYKDATIFFTEEFVKAVQGHKNGEPFTEVSLNLKENMDVHRRLPLYHKKEK